MKPLRVGFVIDALNPGGGTENQLLLLLRKWSRSDIEPRLCTLHDTKLEGLDDVSHLCLRVGRLATPKGFIGLWRMSKWMRQEKLDLMVTFFRDSNFMGTIAAKFAGVPVVSSRRNLGKGYWHTPNEIRRLRFLNGMTQGFIANSDAVRRYTIESEGVPEHAITVIPNAIDLDRFRPRRNQERPELLPSGFLIGCVANFRPIKGLDLLIPAFAQVANHALNPQLVLFGAGDTEPELRRVVRAHGIESQVHFLGRRHDVPDLLPHLDMAVLPSRGESLSNAVVEYLAVGLPVVATDVGGTRELLLEGGLGSLVPPESSEALGKALLALLDDPDRRAQLGRDAVASAKKRFAVDAVLPMWVETLRRFHDAGEL